MTDEHLPSGTDRIYQALQRTGSDYECIINLQGDLPVIDPDVIARVQAILVQSKADISTLVAPIHVERERTDPNVVKVAIAMNAQKTQGRAMYFSRATIPHGAGTLYHHIGIYGYTKKALQQFVSLPPSVLELREKLEQLRALENGLHIQVGVVDSVPYSVDTKEDLDRVVTFLSKKN
jgi:3-deoxy-manno-octulosonate cytidylyltransferase (CMP-KDO synthetase)